MKNPVIYIARDIERALGKEPSPGYFVVANDGEYARSVQKKYPDFVLIVESSVPLDTFELLEREETAAFIDKASKGGPGQEKPAVIVFKNTARIEELCAKKGWQLLNPSAALAEKIENKITQTEWLGLAKHDSAESLAGLLPAFTIAPAKDIKWEKKPLVLQFAHAHTGQGTILVNSGKELKEIQKQFPDRPVKACEFIKGPTFTVNVAVVSKAPAQNTSTAATQDERKLFRSPDGGRKSVPVVVGGADQGSASDIAIGNPSYQITGMPPLTDSPFATVGNDWSLPHSILGERLLGELRDIAEKIGEHMRESGWCGLFGIDVVYDEERDQMKLIEINARQPASTTFESQLQSKFRDNGLVGATIFEAHLAALTGSPLTEKQIEINDGAQIVQRVTKSVQGISLDPLVKAALGQAIAEGEHWTEKIAKLNAAGYTTIPYSNTKSNSDFLRIQSDKGLMANHGKWNSRGEKIIEILEK